MKIEDIKSPEFLKNLNISELNKFAFDVRKFLIENVSITGGHLSSNLGMVEISIALHYVFNSLNDKIIYDVGHQTYTHKILTGRSKDFRTLRKKNGLSGFLKYKESPYDVWEAGHSSTSISAAAGFLEAKSMGADIGNVVSLVGDGAIQNGLVFSALNYLGAKRNQKAIVILNDNNMFISQNVGSFSKIFDKIRIKKSYQTLRKMTPKVFSRVKAAISSYVHGSNIFSSFGFRYFGPIDGHDIKTLIKYFNYAKKSEQSIIIHAKTIKGKGYPLAENDVLGTWHGTGPFDIDTGKVLGIKDERKLSWSKGISDILLDLAVNNPLIKVISPAMIYGSELSEFQDVLPNQIIDVGIAEEHSVVMASTLALSGMIPVISIYSTFMQRTYDQINHDVARTNAHVVFLVDRAGIVGPDGSTHQGTFDIAFLSHLPNMVITMPKDLSEAKALLDYGINKHDGPFVIRYPRGSVVKDTKEVTEVDFGKWEIVNEIKDVNIISYGPVVLKFKTLLKELGKDFGLINARFIKPIDIETLKKLEGKQVIVYEEVILKGSLCSMILETNLKEKIKMEIDSYGIDDQYVEHGQIKELKKELGLDIRDILEKY